MPRYIRYNYMGRELIDWNIREFCGYEPKTTYYTDFGIAEWYGEKDIRRTFRDALKFWGDSLEWMTEIVMVCNWKQWEHYGRGNNKLVELYNELQGIAGEHVLKTFKSEEELSYFYSTID